MPILAIQMPFIHAFPEAEHTRVRVSSERWQIAMEESDELAKRFAEDYLTDARLGRWGPLDNSRNALASIGRQLSTPGHYGEHPILTGPAEVTARLSQLLTPLWTLAQFREFLAYTCGAAATLTEIVDGEPRFSVVPAHELWVDADPNDPRRLLVVRRLRVRDIAPHGPVYCWDVWDISRPDSPHWSVRIAEAGGGLGDEVTREALGADLLQGEAYTWRRPGGSPYVPWAIHRAFDVGDTWNWQRGRNVARGTLMNMLLWSAANRAALNATGKVTLVFGARPLGARLVRDPTSGQSTMSLEADPGEIVYHTQMEGFTQQPTVSEIGAVDTLPALADYAERTAALLAADIGIPPPEASRTGSPSSAAALYISNEQKRSEQRRAGPLCRAADLETLRHTAWMFGIDPAGVGIYYQEIARSPMEDAQDREADQWEVDHGLASMADVMMRRRPGMTRDEALAELQRVAAESQQVFGGISELVLGQLLRVIDVYRAGGLSTVAARSLAAACAPAVPRSVIDEMFNPAA